VPKGVRVRLPCPAPVMDVCVLAKRKGDCKPPVSGFVGSIPTTSTSINAPVVKLADTRDLKSLAERHTGSNPVGRTMLRKCLREWPATGLENRRAVEIRQGFEPSRFRQVMESKPDRRAGTVC
jgi:hypothetical protein